MECWNNGMMVAFYYTSIQYPNIPILQHSNPPTPPEYISASRSFN